jgi:nifR3 family TIM-barrel protein
MGKERFPFNGEFFLAPMAGITDLPFRSLMKRLGAEIVVSELVSADGIHFGGDKTKDLMRFDPKVERPYGLQLFGHDPERLHHAAQKAEAMGVDFIDLNLGCPVTKVVKKGAGSALLKNPNELAKILKALVDAVDIPVTIKIRTGWDQSQINAVEITRMAEDCGIAMVAIHGRTRAQKYEGEANWDIIGEAALKSGIKVVGNGDVTTAEGALKRQKDYPVAGVMIGRGCLKNPFLFQEIQALRAGDSLESVERNYLQLIQEQNRLLQMAYAGRREKLILILMRKFIAWYTAGYPGGARLRKELFQIPSTEELLNRARDFFDGLRWETRQDLNGFLMGGHG